MAKQNTNSSYQQQYDTFQRFDNMSIDLQSNDKDKSQLTKKDVDFDNVDTMSMDEPILAPKMSELSTSIIHAKETVLEDIKAEVEEIPNYLTKQNKSFQQMICQVQSAITTAATATNNNNTEELRKITILIYKIMVIQTYYLLWTTYLRSGTGKLILPTKEPASYSTTIFIWPKEIKAFLQLTNHTNNSNENEIYLNFANEQLHELKHQLKQYQHELNIKANHFTGYTLTIQKMIETYIEQNLQSFRMKIEHQIELIHYDYHIRALKLEYFRHEPNPYQEQLFKQTCQSKYEQETTEQELNFLKQQITYYNSPSQSFQHSQIAHSILIDSVQNPDIRQQLLKQYRETAEQSRANLFDIYLKCAEEQREECKKKYEDSMKKMWSAHRSPSSINENIPLIMVQLIDQRCTKISERIQCIYKFKAQPTLS